MAFPVSNEYQGPSPLAKELLSQLPALPVGMRNGLCLELLLPHGNVVKFSERALRSLNYDDARIIACATAVFSHLSILSSHGNAEAIEQLRHIANDGDARAQYHLGLTYKEGLSGVAKDEEKALCYFLLAADQGHDGAQFLLRYMCSH